MLLSGWREGIFSFHRKRRRMGKTNLEQENVTNAGLSHKQTAREDKASQSLQEERLRLAKD